VAIKQEDEERETHLDELKADGTERTENKADDDCESRSVSTDCVTVQEEEGGEDGADDTPKVRRKKKQMCTICGKMLYNK
jgi:hypothetical protein